MDSNNPIKYSDLVRPDSSITDLIKQLQDLAAQYEKSIKDIKEQASQLANSLRGASGATDQGREAIRKASTEADRLAQAEKKLQQARAANRQEIAKLNRVAKEKNELTKLIEKRNKSAEGSYNRLSAQYSLNKIRLNAMSKSMREGTEEGRKLEEETRKIYEEMKRLQANTGKMQLNVGNYPQIFGAAARSVGGLGSQLATMATATGPLGVAIAGVTTAVAGASKVVSDSFSVTKDYNHAISILAAVTGESRESLKQLTDQARELGATTRYTATEVVQLQTELAKLGYTQDEIHNMTAGVLAFAQATGAELADAASLAGAALRQFGADSTHTDEYVDKMAASVTKSAISFEYLQTAMSIVAPVANAFGFKMEDVLALLGQLANAGFDASSAATATRNIILNLADANGKLAKSLGKPVTNLDDLMNGLVALDKAGIDLATSLDLTDKRSVAQFQTFIKGAEDTLTLRDALNDANGAAEDMANTMADDLEGDIASLSSAYDDLMIELGSSQGVYRDVVQWLTDLVRKIGTWTRETKTYFTDLYIESTAARAAVVGIGSAFSVAAKSVKLIVKELAEVVRGFAGILEGVFTLDFDKVESAYNKMSTSLVSNTAVYVKSIIDVWKEGQEEIKNSGEKMRTELEAQAKEEAKKEEEEAKKATEEALAQQKAAKEALEKLRKEEQEKKDKKAKRKAEAEKREAEKRLREAERRYKANLSLVRKYEDAQLEAEEDGYEKKRKNTIYQYTREIEDLTHKLQTDLTLTEEGKKAITATIEQLQKNENEALQKLALEHQVEELQVLQETIELRLSAVKEGTDQEIALRMQLLDVEKQIALLRNKMQPAAIQQSEEDITSKYTASAQKIADDYVKAQMDIIDKQQTLAATEFELLSNSEERKTRFRLQAERDRIDKILEMNEKAGTKLTDLERQQLEAQKKLLDKKISESKTQERTSDIYGLLGINIDDDKKEAVNEAVEYAMGQLQSIMAMRTQAAEQAVKESEKEVEAAQRRLDAEVQARQNGYASNVEFAQKELDEAKKQQQKAVEDKKRAQRQEQAIASIQEANNLVLASAKIWGQLGFPWAIPAIGVMWGSFAAAKIKAFQMTKTQEYADGTVELLQGGSHASGHDIDLGTKPDGTKRRAEGGEFFAVINKRNSRRYRGVIPDVINSLNNGTFGDKYMQEGSQNVDVNVADNIELGDLNNNVRAIREQGQSREYVDQNGNKVVIYKNRKRIVRK